MKPELCVFWTETKEKVFLNAINNLIAAHLSETQCAAVRT